MSLLDEYRNSQGHSGTQQQNSAKQPLPMPAKPRRENAIAVRVIDRSAYDATSRVHAHRQRKNMSYLRNGCCIYYLRPTGSAHL